MGQTPAQLSSSLILSWTKKKQLLRFRAVNSTEQGCTILKYFLGLFEMITVDMLFQETIHISALKIIKCKEIYFKLAVKD